MQPGHRGAAIDQPSDSHAVIEQRAFARDDVDLARRRQPPDLGRGGHPRGAVADNDDLPDAGLDAEIDIRRFRDRLGEIARVHPAVDGDAALQRPADAGHPCATLEAEPPQGREFVVARRAQAILALDDDDRVGAAHAHAAAEIDRDAGGLDALQQRLAGVGRKAAAGATVDHHVAAGSAAGGAQRIGIDPDPRLGGGGRGGFLVFALRTQAVDEHRDHEQADDHQHCDAGLG